MTINFVPDAAARSSGICLRAAIDAALSEHFCHLRNLKTAKGFAAAIVARSPPGMKLEEITTDWLRQFVKSCTAAGNLPSTINLKLSFVSVLFDHHKAILPREAGRPYKPEIPWVPKRHDVKWWLTPHMEPKVTAWLRERALTDFAEYVEWTCRTGLRVEESLRVQRCHFDAEQRTLSVPGTKTVMAQRVIPLYTEAYNIAHRRLIVTHAADNDYLFNLAPTLRFPDRCLRMSAEAREKQRIYRNYDRLNDVWSMVKDAFGLQGNKTATLKALRRSFARVATDNGMPTEILQRYMGHEIIETTLDYLKVVGGYNLDVVRQWVT
jgi:integrase